MPKLEIQIFLCPNEAYQTVPADPDPTWPTPKGVTLRLTQTPPPARGPYAVTFPSTTADGITSKTVTAGTYNIAVLDSSLNGWIPYPGTVTVAANSPAEKIIRLVPAKDEWLLPLHLCYYGEDGKRRPLAEAEVEIPGRRLPVESRDDGYVYASILRPFIGNIAVSFKAKDLPGVGVLKPQREQIQFKVVSTEKVAVAEIVYSLDTEGAQSPTATISISPTVSTPSNSREPLIGASATIKSSSTSLTRQLAAKENEIKFENLSADIYSVSVTPPKEFDGWPLEQEPQSFGPQYVSPWSPFSMSANFEFKNVRVTGRIQTADGRLVEQDLPLEAYGSNINIPFHSQRGKFDVELSTGTPLKIRLGADAEPKVADIPLEPPATEQSLLLPPSTNVVVLQFQYGISGQAVDESGNPLPGGVVDIFDDRQRHITSVAAGGDGRFVVGTKTDGGYFFAPRIEDGQPVTHNPVNIQCITDVGKVVFPTGRNRSATAGAGPGQNGDGSGPGAGHIPREAVIDLASYPVLTEEVSTTGVPAPAAGGAGGGMAGAGYGQAVNLFIRVVLGWRPTNDVAGFQAALTGAFQLRDVEGHTAWTWQQRGYAVQADMGALTGAQASIYARAKAALDQMQPLLTGVTALNPVLYPPEDLEAIRTVITVELQELVNELALEGGPRIQRVDELFRLLVGESRRSFDPNPDHVQGQLGTMRDRFGLTEEWVDTVDQERILTNFRVVVEQVLSLQESWFYDRRLLSVVDSRSSLGTILIWLSRGLEAVCESVDDLTFALDSVYVDPAQRQVIELKLPNQAPLLLSDLLDWVVRAARDEGPRLIQDAGRDGVNAFAPQLQELQTIVQQTRTLIRTPGSTLPDGMRTPRVHRAFQVVEAQLTEATRLAGLVQQQSFAQGPQITSAVATPPSGGQITVTITGTNFRRHASAVLLPANREDLADLPARHTTVQNPSSATASFRDPSQVSNSAGVTWQVMLTNEDGTRSNMAAI
jgi:hypothetical protein